MADDEDVRITFRVSPDKKERLDNLLNIHNALSDSDEKLTKSDLLRECVDSAISDLEEDLRDEVTSLEEFIEGNPKATPTAD